MSVKTKRFTVKAEVDTAAWRDEYADPTETDEQILQSIERTIEDTLRVAAFGHLQGIVTVSVL